ncbi:Lrp/AsnC family transcriptional regulator [Rhodanobacter geophilus]|uniref:Lrp/AsnC family transcriptional regulator n=1 Tax=Rhodanobacter geophilus TaxID=3162488 RepID=A0ABV3QRC5_9GAMM
MVALDRIDLRLLAVLQTEGRITNAELAERVNLSPSACLRRLQRLEADKVVTGYAAQIDPLAVGLGLQAFVRVQLVKHEADVIERFVERVSGWDEVVACHALTGDMDYLLHVYVADLADFSRFLLDHLLNAAGVADVNSSFVLRTVKRSPSLPLSRAENPSPPHNVAGNKR